MYYFYECILIFLQLQSDRRKLESDLDDIRRQKLDQESEKERLKNELLELR